MEVISKMDEPEIDQLSKQLKLNGDNHSNFLSEDNLEKLKDQRSLTEKLNSIKGRDE